MSFCPDRASSALPEARTTLTFALRPRADLSTLTAYLASHPPGSLAPSTQSLSSPEGSDGSSPSSSDGAGANPAPAATNTQSGHAPAPTDKRKVEPKVTAALKDRRASNGAEPVDGIHTHPDAFDDDDGAASTSFFGNWVPPATRLR